MARKETPSIFCSMETFREGIEEKLTFEGLLIKTSLSLYQWRERERVSIKDTKKLFLLISTDRKKLLILNAQKVYHR